MRGPAADSPTQPLSKSAVRDGRLAAATVSPRRQPDASERIAMSALILLGERPIRERTKSSKDLLQATAIIEWCLENGRKDELKGAWDDAAGRGRGWKQRVSEGRQALLRQAPTLDFA